jgi:hypothetical protein
MWAQLLVEFPFKAGPTMTSKNDDFPLNAVPSMVASVWQKLLFGVEVRMPEGFAIGPLDLLSADLLRQTSITFPKFEIPKMDLPSFELPDIDFDDFHRRVIESVKKLATHFWSLPWHMSLPELQELVQMGPNNIDDYFADYFEGEPFGRLRDDVLGDEKLKRWQQLLNQCFSNYDRDEFQICIPSLLVILEGSFNYSSFFNEKLRKKFFEERISIAAGFDKVIWVSLHSFCEVLFLADDPRKHFAHINRHKILHGFDDPSNWKKVDCLRLFQALDSTRRLISSESGN